jgi:hypothetical protein
MDKKIVIIWVVGIIILIGAIAGYSYRGSQRLAKLSSRDIALSCTTDMATQFHIHPHLEIYINGQQQVIPSDTGITPACMHSIHTHDTTGTLHVESPVAKDFTLGDFFAVWNRPFSQDQILDAKADAAHTITMTVNGQKSTEYEHLVLRDLDKIIISYEVKK